MLRPFIFALIMGIFFVGCADKPSDKLIKRQIDFYKLFGDVKNFKKLNEYREKNYYVVEVSLDLYINEALIKENLELLDPEEAEEYKYFVKRLEDICGIAKKPCKIKDKFKFIKGYSRWYRVFKNDKFEGIQLR